MINLPVGDNFDITTNTGSGIHDPQHARTFTQGIVLGTSQPVVMDIYTGTCVFDFKKGDLERDKLISLVPLGLHGTGPNVDIQSYPINPQFPVAQAVTAIISASMTSFGEEPTGAAVDGALVQLETHSFPGALPANVLVIHAEIGVEDGNLHRLAYQVTVLAPTTEEALTQPGMVLAVGPNQTVPA
jgi:hypothetical protein